MVRGILFFLVILFSGVSWGQSRCFSQAEISDLAQDFPQLKSKLNTSGCVEDLGKSWYQLVSVLLFLKTVEANPPRRDVLDDLTWNHIPRSWWSYFKERVSLFEIEKKCREHVVAFVRPGRFKKTVFLCPLFFEFTNLDIQVSFLLHEARHFDGHSHISCNQGDLEGSRSCDNKISEGGSYAISVQSLVSLARRPGISYRLKMMLESQSLYFAVNHFNTPLEIKFHSRSYISDGDGRIYHWDRSQNSKDSLSFVTQLDQPARFVAHKFLDWSIYPFDRNLKAYNLDRYLSEVVDSSEDVYWMNWLLPDRFQQYKGVLIADGRVWFLNDKNIFTWCGFGGTGFVDGDISSFGDFVAMMPWRERIFLIDKKGAISFVKCIKEEKTEKYILGVGAVNAFWNMDQPFVFGSFQSGGEVFGFLKSGDFVKVNFDPLLGVFGFSKVLLPVSPQNGWVSGDSQSFVSVYEN